MARNDGLNLVRALLSMALAALPISPRQIEDALQIGHGTLPRLLDGRMDLKLRRHLLPLCQALQIHPSQLLARGLPHWEATHSIDDWLPPDHRQAARPAALSDELLQAIRTVVREEISHAGPASGVKREKTARKSWRPRERSTREITVARAE